MEAKNRRNVKCNHKYFDCLDNYSVRHDAYWCDEHNAWVSPICGDKDCHFCKDRPEDRFQ